jgi:protein-L-isoaspartate(D-aspartate) O-methyltransferase
MRVDSDAGSGVEDPETLRTAMVEELRELGAVRTEPVERAFRAVPRHLFSPEASPMEAYAVNRSVTVKRREDGTALSTLSAPSLQADMLEQAEIAPGMRVLEIGSGGVNAALLAELVGPSGQVVTVDIDPDVTELAQRGLTEAGYDQQVTVVCSDAESASLGVAGGPFDRVLVTFGAWDLPPAWLEHLAEDGRLIVPLRLAGVTRSLALEHEGDRLVSRSAAPCGFVLSQGEGGHDEHVVLVEADVGLRFDDEPTELDVAGLRAAMVGERVERWSGLTVGAAEQIDDLTLWLVTQLPAMGMLTARQSAVDRGLVGRPARRGVPALIQGGSFAYRGATRATSEGDRFEFGVYGHGEHGSTLAEDYIALMRQWDQQHRHGPGAVIELYPASTPDAQLPTAGVVLDKPNSRVVIVWP